MSQSHLSTYHFSIEIPMVVTLQDASGLNIKVDRDYFYEWVWNRLSNEGLLGVHEGSMLSEEATEQGLETESWTVDAGEAPRERDWVGKQSELNTELYFSGFEEARYGASVLRQVPEIKLGPIEEQKPRDWDAEWKASFLNAGAGVEIPPFWRIVPPWVEKPTQGEESVMREQYLKINPGAGFGTGTHEATQLCLQVVGELSNQSLIKGVHALDFGSGSGILSIGLALMGAHVDAVEIDPLAIDNSIENASLNRVEEHILFHRQIPPLPATYSVIVANILRPILLEFAELLVGRLAPRGVIILSGLIQSDVDAIVQKYSNLMGMPATRILERGEWRAVVFQRF